MTALRIGVVRNRKMVVACVYGTCMSESFAMELVFGSAKW